jgi:GntR family transcriptional regulator
VKPERNIFRRQEEIIEENKLPLYKQLRNIIKNQIELGSLKPGDRIPTDSELCDRYKVSRITVRQAISSLVQEGLLYRRPGKGTFVTFNKLRRKLPRLYSFSEDMKELGLKPSSRVLEQILIEANKEMFELFKLPVADSKVTKLVRVRLANKEPILIEKTFIPHYLCPDLVNENLEKNSLYNVLKEKYGLTLDNATENYEVTSLAEDEAKALNYFKNSPAFFIERIAYLENGIPVELTRSISRGDRLRFTIKLLSDRVQIQRNIDLE